MTHAAPYHHGDLKRALIEEGFRQLEAVGLEGLSLRALAESAGVSKSAPYRHFADKSELLSALAAAGFGDFADVLERSGEASASEPSGLRLALLAEAYIGFARSRPALYRLMFSPLGYSLHSEACRINAVRAFDILVGIVEQARREGWKSEKPLMPVAMSVWAEVHGWAGLLIDGLLPDAQGLTDEAWRESIAAFLSRP